MSQPHLVSHLSEAIDRILAHENRSGARAAELRTTARAALDALLDTNPNAVASTHVQHNIGRARRAWLVAYQRARAARNATSI